MKIRKLPTKKLEGFIVIIPSNNLMDCSGSILKLQVTIGYYTLKDNFYVSNVVNTNLVLGVKRLYSIGEYSTNYKVQEMSFKNTDGKQIVLKGINTCSKQVVSSHNIRSILRHGYI